jgi:hypothetical protein
VRTLTVTSGPAAGQQVEVDRELVIGREGVDVVVPDDEMSRRHAVVRPVEQGVQLEDLGSLNGTYVEGQRISAPYTIVRRTVLRMGASEFALDVSVPVAPAEPPQPQPVAPQFAPTAVQPAPVVAAPAAAGAPAAAASPAPTPAAAAPAEPGEVSRVESPQLPIVASIAIFIAAVAAVVVLWILTH